MALNRLGTKQERRNTQLNAKQWFFPHTATSPYNSVLMVIFRAWAATRGNIRKMNRQDVRV